MSVLGDFKKKVEAILAEGKPDSSLKSQVYFMIQLSYQRIQELESDLPNDETKRIVEKMIRHFESLLELVQAYSDNI